MSESSQTFPIISERVTPHNELVACRVFVVSTDCVKLGMTTIAPFTLSLLTNGISILQMSGKKWA